MKTQRKARAQGTANRGHSARHAATQRKEIRLLIADDHAMILEGLAATIGRQKDMRVVAKAADGLEAVNLWKVHRPDVVLLDLRMHEAQGRRRD